jgi:hypothetical protein
MRLGGVLKARDGRYTRCKGSTPGKGGPSLLKLCDNAGNNENEGALIGIYAF